MPWRHATSTSRAIPAYSPRGDSDDRPNVFDSRYTQMATDAPVELPLSSRRGAYLLAAVIVVAFVGMLSGLLVASRSAAARNAATPSTVSQPAR